MRNELKPPKRNESLIINLDDSRGRGTHWVAVKKRGNKIVYFDSFGVRPPLEVINHYYPNPVYYNTDKVQSLNATNCGRLCLKFLTGYNKKEWNRSRSRSAARLRS